MTFLLYGHAYAFNCQANHPGVLTRRDQLKKKEQAAEERKKKATAKAKPKSKRESKSKGTAPDEGDEKEGEDPPKEDPPARGRKRRALVEKPDGDAVEKVEPKRRASRRKLDPELEPQAPEPSGSEPTPAPKRKTRGKANAKAQAAASAATAAGDKEPEQGDKEQNEIPEKSKEAKQAPKRAPKRKAKVAKVEKEEEINTPKKTLFQSEDEGDDCENVRIDSKSGEPKPLSQIYEEDKPEEWKRTRPKKAEPSAASSAALPKDDKPAKKRRTKKTKQTTKNSVELSPFSKKEAKRRKNREENTMKEQLVEDSRVQGIFLQHMKAVDGLEIGELKKYLLRVAPKDLDKFVLDPYWGREACGVKSKELASETTLPQVSYIGRFGTAPSSNCGIVLSYVSAFLIVSWLESFVMSISFFEAIFLP